MNSDYTPLTPGTPGRRAQLAELLAGAHDRVRHSHRRLEASTEGKPKADAYRMLRSDYARLAHLYGEMAKQEGAE
jgi:hypothetical protein